MDARATPVGCTGECRGSLSSNVGTGWGGKGGLVANRTGTDWALADLALALALLLAFFDFAVDDSASLLGLAVLGLGVYLTEGFCWRI